MPDEKPPKPSSHHLNRLVWVVIVLGFIATAVFLFWVTR
jgi:hypothetical protein